MRKIDLEPLRCSVLVVFVLSIAGSPAALANSIHRHNSRADAVAAMDQLMLFGNSAPSTQLVESKSRRSAENGGVATDSATTFSPSSVSSLDTPIDTGTPRLHHRQSLNVTSSINDPGPISTVLDTIPTVQYGRHHHPGEVVSLQSGVVLDSPFSGAITEGMNDRLNTPLGDPLPAPSPVPEPGSPALTLAAFAVAGLVFRKVTAKA